MGKLKILTVLATFVMAFCTNAFVFAYYGREEDNKVQQTLIKPVWIHLSDQVEPSNHNPAGTKVVYGMDVASSKTHSSGKKDFGFWLAKITKAKNEIELTYVRMAKDKTRYREVQKQIYYLDGTLKDVKFLQSANKDRDWKDLDDGTAFYYAPEITKEIAKQVDENRIPESTMEVPKLPDGFNKIQLHNGRPGFENWICLLDDRSTGIDSKDARKLTMVTYAYNVADRVYLKGVTHVERTGPTSYTITDGNSYLYTFENKLLHERNGKRSYFISDQAADSIVDYKFMFYKERKKGNGNG